MPEPEFPQTDPGRFARINTILCLSLPPGLALAISAICFGFQSWNEALICAGIIFVPAIIGFVIALKWKRLHPGLYSLIGFGMAIASACVLTALAVGACFGFFAIGGNL